MPIKESSGAIPPENTTVRLRVRSRVPRPDQPPHVRRSLSKHSFHDFTPRSRMMRGWELLASWSSSVYQWFLKNTFTPDWVPARWRDPAVAYGVAAGISIVMIMLSLIIVSAFTAFLFPGTLGLLGIALVALNWGAGPSLLATAVTSLLLWYAVLPIQFSFVFKSIDEPVGLLFFMAAGVTIGFVSSQVERARRNAERLAASLEEERAHLEGIIEAVPDTLVIVDASGHPTRLNAAGQRALNSEGPNDVANLLVAARDLRMADDAFFQRDDLPFMRALRGETVSNLEMRFREQDGTMHYFAGSASPLRNAKGKITGSVALAHDIGSLRRAEQEAADHSRQLEAIFEAVADGMVILDIPHNTMRMNAAAREIVGDVADTGKLDASPAKRLAALFPMDVGGNRLTLDQHPLRQIFEGATIKGEQGIDLRLRTPDGRDVLIGITGAPLRDGQGKVQGAVLIVRDITERRAAEQRTHEALDALLDMAETLVQPPDEERVEQHDRVAIIARRLADLTRSVLGCRRVSVTAIELETERLRPLTVIGLTTDEEMQWWASQAEDAYLDTSDIAGVAEQLRDGEVVVLEPREKPSHIQPSLAAFRKVLISPMIIAGDLVGIIAIDFGGSEHTFTLREQRLVGAVARLGGLALERERLLQEREESRANEIALREANRQMDDFLSIASHEIKTPLTSIKASIQLSIRRLDSNDMDAEHKLDRIRDLLQRTDKQIVRQTRLVNDLLDVSRIERDKFSLHPQLCDIGAIVRDAIEEQRQNTPEREIIVGLPEETMLMVEVDPDRISQVVMNYLTNAVKYTPDDTPIGVSLRRESNMVRLAIRDGGPGLTPDEQAHIWERFHRIERIEVLSGSVVGLGLGLHISRTIIERHGGQVGVESKIDQGSTFWFTLPLVMETSDHGESGIPLAAFDQM